MNRDSADRMIASVPVAKIRVGERSRALREDAVAALVESIKSIGLQTPISAQVDESSREEQYLLVAGRHRLEACRRLGMGHVDARIVDLNETERRLWENSSGNPSGRPKLPEDVKELARGLTKEAIQTLAAVMRDAHAPHSARVRSAEVILDRAWGRPETSANIRISQDVRDLSTAEILAALATFGIAAAEPGVDGSEVVH
jgi:uncharacterized ParB-like nuclease family protein